MNGLKLRHVIFSLPVLLAGSCSRHPSQDESAVRLASSPLVGEHQLVTAVFSDPKGVSDIHSARLLINQEVDGRAACYLQYIPLDNTLVLVNDNGEGSTQKKLGDGGELSNHQCRLALGTSSATVSGNQLKLVLDLHFARRFAGEKQVFQAVRYVSGEETALAARGEWSVKAGCADSGGVPEIVSASPAAGGGWSETFSFTFDHPAGSKELADTRVLFNRKIDAVSSCYVAYDPESGSIRLADDSGRNFETLPPKSTNFARNSQCAITASDSSISRSGTGLSWRFKVTFKPSFAGRKNIYLYAVACNGTNTGFRKKGNWTVPYGNAE